MIECRAEAKARRGRLIGFEEGLGACARWRLAERGRVLQWNESAKAVLWSFRADAEGPNETEMEAASIRRRLSQSIKCHDGAVSHYGDERSSWHESCIDVC